MILAWAYILSARWLELQLPNDPMRSFAYGGMCYSEIQAARTKKEEETSLGAIKIDIGGKCEQTGRWWAAILAPGEGWRATIEVGNKIYRSPWSAHIASPQILNLRNAGVVSITDNKSKIPPSANQTLDYIREYCELHDINNQCIPALAASLFLPWKNRDGSAVLPLLKPSRILAYKLQQWVTPASLHFERCLQSEYRLLPYYMTLSCNIRGLGALLASFVFDPSVPCNLVSPGLQPIFEILDPIIANEDSTSLAMIMSRSQPSLAALWLGAIILGLEKTILRPVRSGLFNVELHAAAWTGTIHSFINLKPNTSCVTSRKEIDRSDECRLLFLTGSESHQRPPISPWQPFGTTSLNLVDIEVRQHATCTGHCLQYIN